VTFGADYPMQAPEFCFLRPAPKHPHIYSNGTRPLTLSARKPALALPRCCFLRRSRALYGAGHICLDILYDSGAWSPALTVASVARSLQSMLLTSPGREAPPGDEAYCRRVGDASPRNTRWVFHDDSV
jgi:ubiquitin-conjugating enzyme E2 W